MCSSSTTSGKLYACMGCRHGECRLGYRSLSVLYFLFYVAGNTLSQLKSVWGGAHPLKWVWHPLKCAVPPSEVFVFYFLSGAGMNPGVLDCVSY